LDLVGHRAARKMARIPARDARKAVTREHRAQRIRSARELVAELEALVADRLALGERRLERRLAAERRQVVVAPRDRVDPDPHVQSALHGSCFCRSWSYFARASRTSARADTSGTATSHHHPPASTVRRGSVSMHTTLVWRAERAWCSAASSSDSDFTCTACAPSERACAAKSIAGAPSGPWTQSSSRLLKGAPPHACCSPLMKHKPRLLRRT